MMRKLAALLLLIAALGALLCYMQNCLGGSVTVSDYHGKSRTINADSSRSLDALLQGLPADSGEARAILENTIATLDSYTLAIRAMGGDSYALSTFGEKGIRQRKAEKVYEAYLASRYASRPGSLEEELAVYSTALAHIEYAESYHLSAGSVAENADRLLFLGLYGNEKGFVRSNIQKTKKDFYGLESISLSYASDDGLLLLVRNRQNDLFALLAAVTAALFGFQTSGKKGYAAQKALLLTAAVAALYTAAALLTAQSYGLGNLGRSLQSSPAFHSCPALLSTGAFLALWLLAKLAGCLLVYHSVLYAASSLRQGQKLPALLVVAFFAAELWLYANQSSSAAAVLLREINLFAAFDIGRFFGLYLNLNLFGQAVSRLPLFVLWMALLVSLSAFFAGKSLRSLRAKLEAEAERLYFDELNRRHAEMRGIRHDMQNHLLVLRLLLDRDDTAAARQYIDEWGGTLEESFLPARTAQYSAALDALLCQKTARAREQNTLLTLDIGVSPCGLGISDYELGSIFGNLLDNALEATAKLPETQRMITLTVSRRHEMLLIACENPYAGELIPAGGYDRSTKKDGRNHGLGLKTVESLCRKHGGEMFIGTDDHVFCVRLLLGIQEKT